MINNSNFKSSSSLNEAFELILKIFDEERVYYENTINSLKEKVSELEKSLINVKKENLSYQSRISKLKGKLRSISKTFSKLEESDFDMKIGNTNKSAEKNEILINNTSQNQTLKYRNTETINSFRQKSKIINKSTNIIKNINNHYLKMNILDNNKTNKYGEDISKNYNNNNNNKKLHKKNLSTRIKNSILNINNSNSRLNIKKEEKKMFNSHCYNDDDDVSIFLINKLNKNETLKKMTVEVDTAKIMKDNRKKNLKRDKYNKIEQKIKGLKSALNIYCKKDHINYNENIPNSVNTNQNISNNSTPYII